MTPEPNATPTHITFVTGNPGKVRELAALLEPHGIEVRQDDRGYPEVQADDLEMVARAGAEHLLSTGLEPPFVLEDAGLFITALRGFPGVYSSHTQSTIGNSGVLDLLRDIELEGRTAAFRAVLLYVDANGDAHAFTGTCPGRIADRASGAGGFGFDPIFIPTTTPPGASADATFADLTPQQKDTVSHRGAAAAAFVAHLGHQPVRQPGPGHR